MPTIKPLVGQLWRRAVMDRYSWVLDDKSIDWTELSALYRIAPLGNKSPEDLRTVFANSMFKCFVHAGGRLVGAGRALADGLDCSYLADVAVHPAHQRLGLGKELIQRLVALSEKHKKIILYANRARRVSTPGWAFTR